MEDLLSLLPPHWIEKQDGSGYINEVTGEQSSIHPGKKYLEKVQQTLKENSLDESGNLKRSFMDEKEKLDNLLETKERSSQTIVKEKYFDYRTTWTERDVQGQPDVYGLCIRYFVSQKLFLVRFDGLGQDWVDANLQGNYGPITLHDLFIGAKVNVFGRHITISSANGSAIQFIESEGKKLQKQQEYFQSKIESIGKVPIVRRKKPEIVHHITRNPSPPGHVNLRLLINENARLGEHIAELGIAQMI